MTLVEYLQYIKEENEEKLNWNRKYHVKIKEELKDFSIYYKLIRQHL